MALEDTQVYLQVMDCPTLTLENKENIVALLRRVIADGIHINPDAPLNTAFAWRLTAQGHNYWDMINNMLRREERIYYTPKPKKEKVYAQVFE